MENDKILTIKDNATYYFNGSWVSYEQLTDKEKEFVDEVNKCGQQYAKAIDEWFAKKEKKDAK